MAPGQRSRLAPRADVPLSRPIAVEDVPEGGLEVEVVASESERAAVAAETGLPAIARLVADLVIERRNGGRYAVTGTLEASITQICVVTLEPFDSDIVQDIDLTFAPAAPAETAAPAQRSSRRNAETRPAAPPPPAPITEDDPPDPIVDGIIDLGTVAVEFLTLGRDLYPRKPGVDFKDVTVGEETGADPSPFAALQRLKDRS